MLSSLEMPMRKTNITFNVFIYVYLFIACYAANVHAVCMGELVRWSLFIYIANGIVRDCRILMWCRMQQFISHIWWNFRWLCSISLFTQFCRYSVAIHMCMCVYVCLFASTIFGIWHVACNIYFYKITNLFLLNFTRRLLYRVQSKHWNWLTTFYSSRVRCWNNNNHLLPLPSPQTAKAASEFLLKKRFIT